MHLSRLFCLIACLTAAPTLRAAEFSIELPAETATLKKAAGLETAMAMCLQCHSTEYISSQPPMPRKFWEAAVVKMKDKYGAPIPPELVPGLADYLVAAYGVTPAAK